MTSRTYGMILGVCVVALWGSAFSAITLALDAFHPLTLVPLRLGVAAIALLALGAWKRVPLPNRRDLPRICGCAATGMTGYQLLLNLGEVDVPAGTASMIIAAAPLAAAFTVRRNRDECAPRRWWSASVVCIVGVVLVCIDAAGSAPLIAIGALVTAAVIYGLYGPLLKPLLTDQTGLAVTTHITVAAAVMSSPLLLLNPIPVVLAGATSWGAVLYLGAAPSAAAFILWAESLRRLRTSETSALLFLVPVFGVVIAMLVTGQVLTATSTVGSILVLGGLCLTLRRPRPRTSSGVTS